MAVDEDDDEEDPFYGMDAWSRFDLTRAVMMCDDKLGEERAEALVDAFYVFNATEDNPNAGMGDIEFVAECIVLGPHAGEWLRDVGLEWYDDDDDDDDDDD